MPKPLSNDLRARIVRFHENHPDYTHSELANEFEVSLSMIEKLLRRWQTTGSSDNLPPGRGTAATLTKHEAALAQLVAAQPDATLAELQARLRQRRRVRVSQATICRALQRLQLRRKKDQTRQRAATPRRGGRAQSLSGTRGAMAGGAVALVG